MKTKVCTKCKREKNKNEFSIDNSQSSGLRPECRKCVANYYEINKVRIRKVNKLWRDKNKKGRRIKDLKNKYNITLEDYNNLFTKENGRCHICNLSESRKGTHGKIKRLSVDHCHKTGKVRGLLCQRCNSVLGYIEDNKNLLKQMIKYLG